VPPTRGCMKAIWTAPLMLGTRPMPGNTFDRLANTARSTARLPQGALVGHPASPGRARGRVRVIEGPGDFAQFQPGEVLVSNSTGLDFAVCPSGSGGHRWRQPGSPRLPGRPRIRHPGSSRNRHRCPSPPYRTVSHRRWQRRNSRNPRGLSVANLREEGGPCPARFAVPTTPGRGAAFLAPVRPLRPGHRSTVPHEYQADPHGKKGRGSPAMVWWAPRSGRAGSPGPFCNS
jgi:hypothetical protein